MSGCPNHTATLKYQSVSDHYQFNIDGREIGFERGSLQALIDLVKSIDRADCIQIDNRNQTIQECIEALNKKEATFTDYDQDSFHTAIETLQALIK
ncbi:MAG: hypothetical protein WAW92_04575 [Minisyncoccia bacterium]